MRARSVEMSKQDKSAATYFHVEWARAAHVAAGTASAVHTPRRASCALIQDCTRTLVCRRYRSTSFGAGGFRTSTRIDYHTGTNVRSDCTYEADLRNGKCARSRARIPRWHSVGRTHSPRELRTNPGLHTHAGLSQISEHVLRRWWFSHVNSHRLPHRYQCSFGPHLLGGSAQRKCVRAHVLAYLVDSDRTVRTAHAARSIRARSRRDTDTPARTCARTDRGDDHRRARTTYRTS